MDPTTKDLHLGYAVVYEKLRQLQEMGHQIVFLIGDFTARFGDPTDQKKTRGLRNKKEIEACAKNYIKQIGKILDVKKLEIRRNSEWFDKFSGQDILELQSRFTVARMLERDMFQERIKNRQEIYYHEPVYPMLQAYDSVMLKSDLTVIGTDQIFNEIQGRELQREFGQEPQDIIAMSILIGTDGKQKMSQSLGNYIGITESANQQYGKIMSIPDDLIIHYLTLCTDIPLEKVQDIERRLQSHKMNPMDAKMFLARKIVERYHGIKQAEKAEKYFITAFQKKKIPAEIPVLHIKAPRPLIEILLDKKQIKSRSEFRRLVRDGAVEAEGGIIKDVHYKVNKNIVLKLGKKKFLKIELN